jgi:cytochrome b561
MTTQTVYQILKVLHIYGFITAIGITIANLVAYRQFWRHYATDRAHGLSTFQVIQKLQMAGGLGMIAVLLAGIGMLTIHSAFASLLWFQIKLGLIALIFVNGFTLGRTSAVGLKTIIEQKQPIPNEKEFTLAIQQRMQRFLTIQIILFSTIVLLSVFRFN